MWNVASVYRALFVFLLTLLMGLAFKGLCIECRIQEMVQSYERSYAISF